MLYVRTINMVELFDESNKKFLMKKIKGNVIKGFKLNRNKISFVHTELVSKLIPKKDKSFFDKDDIKTMILENNISLTFQDWHNDSDNSLHFLTIDQETGKIIKVPFIDLNVGDSILYYDENLDDYNLSDIKQLIITPIEMGSKIDRDKYSMSSYILKSNDGIILNRIMVI